VKGAEGIGPCQLAVAFSPDGRMLASASQNPGYVGGMSDTQGEVHVWDVRSGREPVLLEGNKGTVSCGVAFSPDSKLLASAGWNPELKPGLGYTACARVWNVATGKEVFTVEGAHNVAAVYEAVAFSPDSHYLAAAGQHQIVLYEARTGKTVRTLPAGARSLSFSPDGRFLAGSGGGYGDRQLKVWEVDTGKAYNPVTPNLNARTYGTQHNIWAAAYSPDGRRLLTTSGSDVRIWDAATGAELSSFGGLKGIDVAWGPDGRRIAVASSDRSTKVIDAYTGQELFALRGPTGPVHSVAFSPDGSVLAAGDEHHMVRLWDATRGQEFHTLNAANMRTGAWPLSVSATGTRCMDGLILSLDGKTMASAFVNQTTNTLQEFHVCAVDSGRAILALNDVGGGFGYPRLVPMAFSPDGAQVAVLTGRKVRRWELATGRELSVLETSDTIASVTFSPDAHTIVMAGLNRVEVHELGDGRETWAVAGFYMSPNRSASRVAFSPDGSRAAIVGPTPENELRLVDVASGKLVRTMANSNGKPIAVNAHSSLAFTEDGRRLLLCDSQDIARIMVWDAETGQVLQAHTGLVGLQLQLSAFSPDGSRLATAVSTEPMEVALWDTATGQEVFTIKSSSRFGKSELQALAWTADGTTLAVADEAGDVRFWSAAPRTEAAQEARRAGWADYTLNWHRRAARDNERDKHWFAAAFHLSRMIEAGPADGALYQRRGLANAQAERWATAADDFGRAIELDRIETFDIRYPHALLLRRKGELEGYRKAVAFLLERWGNTKDPQVARRLLQAYLLDGEKAVERKSVESLVQVMLSANAVAIGVPVKMGVRIEEAKTYQELRQLLKTIGMKHEENAGLTWDYFPLVCARLGDDYEASFWLPRVARHIPDYRSRLVGAIGGRFVLAHHEKVSWEDLLALDLLQQEIDTLIKKAGR
jgi:WD40 repeat protein